ncbi:MAG TPA: HAD family phosphatase [Bryobacteraceae bacterium]|nr:HAD family phosphatase [Bryobacteraceae bacterium]
MLHDPINDGNPDSGGFSDGRYDAVLFDFDGVLADTEPVHFACWREILKPLGITITWENYQPCIGMSERETLAYFGRLADPPLAHEDLWPLYPAKKAMFLESVMSNLPIAPATREFVKSLNGIGLAVVSSSATPEIRPILEKTGLIGSFGALVFAEDVGRHKPAPDPYLLAAEKLGAGKPLVVEDSEAGLASGRAAGFDVLRVTDPALMPELVRARLRFNL